MSFIIDKLLAKKPEQRFQNAQALHEAIAREIAAHGDHVSGRRGVPLRVKLLLVMASVTAAVLTGCVLTVLTRQEATLQRIAILSGASVSDFVTRNSGVMFAENAGLPPGEQDWATLQAYVASAAKDPEIRSMVVSDNEGIVLAASDPRLVGRPHSAPRGEAAITAASEGLNVTQVPDRGTGTGLRFVRPVKYAGTRFGSVDIVVKRAALDRAVADTRDMLILLSLIVIGVVATIGYLSGAMVARPLARLTKALREAADCDFALRISHARRDEFAVAFDAFNAAAAAAEPRLSNPAAAAAEPDVMLTRLAPSQREVA